MAVVIFDYAVWALRFPALAAKVSEELATVYFGEATDFLDNTDDSLIDDVNKRARYLNLLVAHIAALNGATTAGAAGLVGRVSSVTEGSVTIATEFGVAPGSQAWFAQTSWGAEYWALTAGYRTATYVPGLQPFLDVPGPGPWGPNRWPL